MDKRLLKKYRSKGLVTEEDFAAYVKKLPDRADDAEPVTAVQPGDPGAQPKVGKRTAK